MSGRRDGTDAVRTRLFQGAAFVLLIGLWVGGKTSSAWAQAPTEAEVYVDRAILAYDDGRYAEAHKEIQEALRLDPDNVTALYYLGLILIATDQYAEAQAALEKAKALRPTDLDVTFQLGVLHFSQQQYAEAEPPLREVFEVQPRRQNLGFYLGFIAYRNKEYREALRFLRANVPSDENFAQLSKFYTGLALGALGLPAEAQAEVEEAIRLNPTSRLASPAKRFRDVLEPAARRERRFQGEVRFGLVYDDNAAIVPNASTDIVARVLRERDTETTGEVISVRLAYTWLRTVDWEATVSYAFLQTINNDDDLSDFNVQDHTGTVGLTYRNTLKGMPYFTGLQIAYDFITLGGDTFVHFPTFQPFFTLVENAGNLTTFQFRTQLKEFDEDGVPDDEVRDATNYMVGLTHFFRFAEDRHYIKVGYQYDFDDAEGDNWVYSGFRFLVGGQYTLPWGDIRLRYNLDFHLRDYENKHSLLPVTAPNTTRRDDKELLHLVSIAKDLSEDFTVSLDFLFDDNISNLDVFDYDRNVVSLSLTWRF